MALVDTVPASRLTPDADIFVSRFFVAGARDYIRKTTRGAPWLSMGVMEQANPELFHHGPLFRGMNLVGGGGYSLGHGMIHGFLGDAADRQIERAVRNLNALPADEIVFYHDESACGLERARELGLEIRFRPVSLLEWLLRVVECDRERVRPLGATAAVQLPCSSTCGADRNGPLERLFERIGVERAERRCDGEGRVCCGARGYYGLLDGDVRADSDRADALVSHNVADAAASGARYLVTLCPGCHSALASAAREAGLIPVSVDGLVSLGLYPDEPPSAVAFL